MSKAGLVVRTLAAADEGAEQLAVSAGVHGVYVQNALAAGLCDGLVFMLDDSDCGVAWFGARGNLVVLADERCMGREQQIARHVHQARWGWRIAMGPAAIVDALGALQMRPPLVHRDQIYYLGERASCASMLVRQDVRRPERQDRERLARATLLLNASDLNIAPGRVDRRWLYGTIDERIEDGSTRVLGPVGDLSCKLDFGSVGPGGEVIEGVFTFPERRGQGLCAQLVASCIAAASQPVSLHVGVDNVPARRSYERAGMREAGRCRLLLSG